MKYGSYDKTFPIEVWTLKCTVLVSCASRRICCVLAKYRYLLITLFISLYNG